MKTTHRAGVALMLLAVLLAGCALPPAPPPRAIPISPGLPDVVEYNLGDATLTQSHFPEDSRFRNMPVRLNGVIAMPAQPGPRPVVLVMHGTHPGCPTTGTGNIDPWPCAPEDEQPNYRGFAWLVRQLAAQGYVALSINLNAEHTFGFGEAPTNMRLPQIIDLHLKALAEANAGGANNFGVPLQNRADLRRLALIGHSRGGDSAYWLVRDGGLAAPDAFEKLGYGPVAGVLLVAPAVASDLPTYAPVPMAIVLPACDGDVVNQDGQFFLETARLAETPSQRVMSVWLERANHNHFNTVLRSDLFATQDRAECATLLPRDAQMAFLSAYAADFLSTLFGRDALAVKEAMTRMGADASEPAPNAVYGRDARVMTLPARDPRQTLLVPADADALTTGLAGGTVTAQALTTHFCDAGFYTLQQKPDSAPCRRVTLVVPGQPAHAVASWEQAGGEWRFALPQPLDASTFAALTMRATLDPLSPLNAKGQPQRFSVRLTDAAGKTATVATTPDAPALQFPIGEIKPDDAFGELFTGRAPLTDLRMPLDGFAGVDLKAIREVALVFDQTPSGTLFLADLAFDQAP
jgi:dienelactone hydrolase